MNHKPTHSTPDDENAPEWTRDAVSQNGATMSDEDDHDDETQEQDETASIRTTLARARSPHAANMTLDEFQRYRPGQDDAPQLTRCEWKVLKVLLNPEHFGKTIPEKCKAAGVSKRHWHEIVREETFQKVQRKAAMWHIYDELAPIIAAAVETAKATGRDGHQDRAMLLGSVGIHDPRRGTTINNIGTGPGVIGIVGVNMEDII